MTAFSRICVVDRFSVLVVCLLMAGGRGAVHGEPASAPGAYLFAHMTRDDYGRLYYSVSTNGLTWERLNGGRRVFPGYRGHPDLTRLPDGRWILVGNPESGDLTLTRFWVSTNLVQWTHWGDFKADMKEFPAFNEQSRWHGAPKLFHDAATGRFLVTWHYSAVARSRDDPEAYWTAMRTFFVTSTNLVDFTPPRRLFPFEMATIDVIVRKEGGSYYAILKDEKYPTFDWPTGKAIRVSRSDHLTGPYGPPSEPVSPNFREAPMLIPRADGAGWLLYFEKYPGLAYEAATAPRLAGPWFDVYGMDIRVPEEARHGCMVVLEARELDGLRGAFPNPPESDTSD